jgi:glycosyltransferase 2 family protein
MNLLSWNQTRGVRLTLCLVVSGVCLYLAMRGMDFGRTVQELQKSSPMPILGAVFFLFLSYWIRAYRWSYLLLPVKQITTGPLFRSTVIGFMGNYILPFRAGEVMRAVSIGHNQNISKAAALGSIVLERVFDGIVISLTPFLVLATVELPPWVTRVNIAFLAFYGVGLLALVMATRRGWTEAWIERATVVLPIFFAQRLKSMAGEFLHGMKGINYAGALSPVFLFSFICWFFHGLYFFLLFEALNLELSFWAALIIQTVIGLGVILPAAPGYVGNFEYFTVLGLALFGITQEAAFAYALLAHICQFIPVTAVGLFFALKNGFHAEVEPHSSRASNIELLNIPIPKPEP